MCIGETVSPSPGRLFCFGAGYSAQALARCLLARGWLVAGTSRSENGVAALRLRGITAFEFKRGRPLAADGMAALHNATHLLSAVPPDEAGDPVLDGMEDDLGGLRPVWAGYLSTTGVYGDTGGAWVDETAPVQPSGLRQQRRVDAERGWLALEAAHGVPIHIFRLAGIYGPGRSALDQVRAGIAKRIDKPDHVFSRIHVDDISGVLLASMARPRPGAVYNVCDDQPAAPADVVNHACQRLGVAPPPLIPFAEAGLSPMAASFWRDNRRVSNALVKRELGVALLYPDYRSGLDAQWRAEIAAP